MWVCTKIVTLALIQLRVKLAMAIGSRGNKQLTLLSFHYPCPSMDRTQLTKVLLSAAACHSNR